MEGFAPPEGLDRERRIRELEELVRAKDAEIEELKERIRNELGIDDLTGLPGRGRFEKALGAYIPREGENRAGVPERTSVLFIDIDHFKNVNDTYGHAVGDVVIRAVAAEIERSVRGSDLVGRAAQEGEDLGEGVAGRLGGEEFVAALPGASVENAVQKAERIRESIANLDFGVPGLRVTVSVGVAEASKERPDTVEGILKRADAAMYAAKSGGRNRVVSAPSA